MVATQEQIDFYNENGYVIIPDFVTKGQLDSFKASLKEKVAKEIDQQVADAVARPYGARLSECMKDVIYFFKDGSIVDGKLNCEPKEAIEMMGACLHQQEGPSKDLVAEDGIMGLAKSLQFKAPMIVSSSIYKSNLEFPTKYFQLENWTQMDPPGSSANFILALSGSNAISGGFIVMKGSHKTMPNTMIMKMNSQATSLKDCCTMEGTAPYMDGSMDDQFTMVDFPAGSMLVVHGLCVSYIQAGDSATSASFLETIMAETDGATSKMEI
jgi:hypothetical protein